MVDIKVEINTKTTIDELKRLERRVNNLGLPFNNYGRWFVKETDKQFDTETDPDGLPWASLRPSTLARKKYLGHSPKILTATGYMRNTLNHKAVKDGLEIFIEGAAEFHQEGTRYMPQRKILGITKAREEKLQEIMERWIFGSNR